MKLLQVILHQGSTNVEGTQDQQPSLLYAHETTFTTLKLEFGIPQYMNFLLQQQFTQENNFTSLDPRSICKVKNVDNIILSSLKSRCSLSSTWLKHQSKGKTSWDFCNNLLKSSKIGSSKFEIGSIQRRKNLTLIRFIAFTKSIIKKFQH